MEIQALISGLAGAKQLASLLINERDRQKAAAIESDFADRVTQLQVQLLEVLGAATEQAEALRVARERVRELEADKREKDRYQLVEAAPGRGFAYRLRPSSELSERCDEPVHFLCQPCFDAGRKVVMQPTMDRRVLLCPSGSGHSIQIEEDPPIDYGSESRWGRGGY